MTEKTTPYWVENVAHVCFPTTGLRLTPDPEAPVYGVDTPQRWPIPPRAKRWLPRVPVRTDAEREAFSAEVEARVKVAIAAREAKRKAMQLNSDNIETPEPSQ